MTEIESLNNVTRHFSLLYIEDDMDLRESTVPMFENLFKSVVVAEDGEIGFTLYDEYFKSNGKYFDIVITDINMPNMNGIDLSKKIISINKEQVIFVLSAHDDKKYLIDLINNGVTGFAQKPLSLEEIISVVYEPCKNLAEEKELFRYLDLGNDFTWDFKRKFLSQSELRTVLTDNETKVFDLFAANINKVFTSLEFSEYIYQADKKQLSEDEIINIIKDLQGKTPNELIVGDQISGYKLQLCI